MNPTTTAAVEPAVTPSVTASASRARSVAQRCTAIRTTGRIVAAGEDGSAAIEAVIGVPAFVLFVGLIICGGRVASTHESLQSAAADAARSASIARTVHVATTDARQAAVDSVNNQQLGCRHISVRVDSADLTKPAGQPGTVSITVSCRLDLSDLSVPGIPGSRVLRATMSSPIDTWRQSAGPS